MYTNVLYGIDIEFLLIVNCYRWMGSIAALTWHAGALVAGVSLLDAGAPAVARRRVAGHVAALAVHARILRGTLAAEGAHLVDAHTPVQAGRRALGALVDVLLAGLAGEELRAGADVVGLKGGALPSVRAGVGGAGVRLLALFTWRWRKRGQETLLVLCCCCEIQN